jgi:RNA polymerase sigma-70 factor (ECF subfamily)
VYEGRDALAPLLAAAFRDESFGEWRLVATRANRMPTAASYLRAPGETQFRAFKLDVIRVQDGLIAEVTTFNADLFEAFGLPGTLAK